MSLLLRKSLPSLLSRSQYPPRRKRLHTNRQPVPRRKGLVADVADEAASNAGGAGRAIQPQPEPWSRSPRAKPPQPRKLWYPAEKPPFRFRLLNP